MNEIKELTQFIDCMLSFAKNKSDGNLKQLLGSLNALKTHVEANSESIGQTTAAAITGNIEKLQKALN